MFSRLHASVLVGLLSLGVHTGCADTAQSSAGNLTVAGGYHELREDDGFVYRDVAVAGGLAFLAKGHRGVHVVDLEQMAVVDAWTHDSAGEQLVVDGLQVVDDSLVVWGQTDDSDPVESLFGVGEFARSFRVKALSLDAPELSWSLTLDLREALLDGGTFVQLPGMAAHVDPRSETMTVSFSHLDQEDRLLHFPLPAEGAASYDMLSVPGLVEVPVDNPKSVVVDDGFAYVPSGDAGLFEVDLAEGVVVNVTDAVGYAVDVRVDGGTAYVADHDGHLHVVDIASGGTRSSVEIPDWVEGIELAGDHVVVGTRNGLFVTAR